MRILTEEQILALANAMPPRYRAFVLTAAYTRLRIGELAALRVRHVNFPRRILAVEETLTEPQGHVQFGPPKTKAGRRTISVPASIVDELASHVAAYVVGSGRAPEALIFAGDHGGPLRPNNSRCRAWPKAVKASIGLPCHPHDLRHSHASTRFEAGLTESEIAARAGWRQFLTRYRHILERTEDRANERLGSPFIEAEHRRQLGRN